MQETRNILKRTVTLCVSVCSCAAAAAVVVACVIRVPVKWLQPSLTANDFAFL